MFCIAFTMRQPDHVKSNCYAQSSQIRRIRKKMVEVMHAEAGKVPLRELVKKLIPESISREIKKPKFDITKLMELHEAGDDDAGVAMLRPEAEDAQNTLAAEVAADDE